MDGVFFDERHTAGFNSFCRAKDGSTAARDTFNDTLVERVCGVTELGEFRGPTVHRCREAYFRLIPLTLTFLGQCQRLTCCTELIKQFHFRRVCIGIPDPNQGVCGKGLWVLQSNNIAVELFPPELAAKIRILNVDFIRLQKNGRHSDYKLDSRTTHCAQ